MAPISSNELSIRPMRKSDLAEVLRLEGECFPHPWTRGMLEEELRRENGAFLVARHWRELVGYAGVIYIMEEGHVTNLAIRKTARRKGIAGRLLLHMIEDGAMRGIRFLTLEVRRSNLPAIRLYEKFGFTVIGERKRYYLDDDEDALIMWTEDITTPEYQCLLVPIAAALQEKKRGWG